MKKIYLFALLLVMGFAANAQRKIRLRVTIDTPVINQNIVTGSIVSPVYTFTNIGTSPGDSLGVGESISFASPTSVVTSASPVTFSTTRLTLGSVLKPGMSFKLNNASITGGYNVPFDSIKTLLNITGSTVNSKPFAANTQFNWFVQITGIGTLAANPTVDSVFGNTDTTIIWINKSTSISNQIANQEKTIATYPNPANNQLSFEYTFTNNESASAHIIDAAGRIVFVKEFVNNNGTQKFDLDITSLQSGFYFLNFVVGDKTMVSKFNVQK